MTNTALAERDIVERLRDVLTVYYLVQNQPDTIESAKNVRRMMAERAEAADEIEHLRALTAALTAAPVVTEEMVVTREEIVQLLLRNRWSPQNPPPERLVSQCREEAVLILRLLNSKFSTALTAARAVSAKGGEK